MNIQTTKTAMRGKSRGPISHILSPESKQPRLFFHFSFPVTRLKKRTHDRQAKRNCNAKSAYSLALSNSTAWWGVTIFECSTYHRYYDQIIYLHIAENEKYPFSLRVNTREWLFLVFRHMLVI